MFKRRLVLILFVLVLGVSIVGVANAAIMRNDAAKAPVQMSTAGQYQTAAQTTAPAEITPDAIQNMIQACWQMNPAMVDQWTKATGMTKEDLLKMEQAWMQGIMQQNPNLNTQSAYNMHQTWLQSSMNSYRTANQTQQTQTQQAPPSNQNNTQNKNNGQYRNNSSQYNGWYCPPGYGYNGYRCW